MGFYMGCIVSNGSHKFYCLLPLLNLYSFMLILHIYTPFIHSIFTGDIYYRYLKGVHMVSTLILKI